MPERYGLSAVRRLQPRRVLEKAEAEVRQALAGVAIRRSPLHDRHFVLWSKELTYVLERYNTTWRNERSVELAVALDFLSMNAGSVLEFGNVLSHYEVGQSVRDRVVLDKYEDAENVINLDVLDFVPKYLFDAIVSISTIEHVGWDERPRNPGKAAVALQHLRSLLKPSGRMLVTAPLGTT